MELFTMGSLVGFNVVLPEGPAIIITSDCEVPILHMSREWQTWINVLPKEFGSSWDSNPQPLDWESSEWSTTPRHLLPFSTVAVQIILISWNCKRSQSAEEEINHKDLIMSEI